MPCVPPELMRRSDEHVCGHAGGEDGQEPEVPAAEGSEAERRREPRPHRAPQSETDSALHDLHHIYPTWACKS